MAERLTIAVDADDVLFHHVRSLVALSNRRWGTAFTEEDYVEDLAKFWAVEGDELEERKLEVFASYGTFEPIAEAQIALPVLKDRHNLVVVTARREMTRASTELSIAKHYPDTFSAIAFAGYFDEAGVRRNRSKAEMCLEMNADYLIDDSVKNCRDVVAIGVQALLFGEYAWNQIVDPMVPGIIRVKNWPAVMEHFDGRS